MSRIIHIRMQKSHIQIHMYNMHEDRPARKIYINFVAWRSYFSRKKDT